MQQTKILIINYNNGADTVACIDSVIGLPDSGVLLIDNASEDDSLAFIIRHLETHAISYDTVTKAGLPDLGDRNCQVLIVKSDRNMGFAGGNNVLLSYAQRCAGAKYAWLLNNDAIAGEGALPALISKMEEDPRTGFTGSVILDYYRRDLVQCCGVKYFKYFGVSKLILKNANWPGLDKKDIPYASIDFQHGASLMVRLSMLDTVGLMDERFFLYFEEHDWQWIARSKGCNNRLAAGSVVYHKGSVSTSNKKHLFFYHYNKSAMIFARKHNNPFVICCSVVLLTGVTLIRARFYYKSVLWGIRGLAEGLFK